MIIGNAYVGDGDIGKLLWLVSGVARGVGEAIATPTAQYRYLPALDPVLNGRYKVAKPFVFPAEFGISFDVLTDKTSGDAAIFDSTTFTNTPGEGLLYIDNPDGLQLIVAKPTAGSFERYIFGGQTAICNGVMNHVDITRDSNNQIIAKLNGIQLGSPVTHVGEIKFSQGDVGGGFARRLDGSIINLKVNNAGVIEKFSINKAPTTDLYEYGGELYSAIGINGWYDFQRSLIEDVNGDIKVTNTSTTQQARGVFPLGVLNGNFNVSLDVITSSSLKQFTYVTTSVSGSSSGRISEGVNDSSTVFLADNQACFLVIGNNQAGLSVSSTFSNVSVKEITNYDIVQTNKNIEYTTNATFGSELITNTLSNWYSPRNASTLSFSGGVITATSSGGAFGLPQTFGLAQTLTNLTVGALYELSIGEVEKVPTTYLRVYETVRLTGGDVINTTQYDSNEKHHFIATQTTLYVGLICAGGALGSTLGDVVSLGDASVREIITGNAITYVNIDDDERNEYVDNSPLTYNAVDPLTIPQTINIAPQI